MDARARPRLLRRRATTCGRSPSTRTCSRSRRTRRRSRARAPAPARRPAPDDDLDGQPRAPAPALAGLPRVHAEAGRASRSRRSARSAPRSSTGSASAATCDFVWDIAAPLPLLLIADMLGFPPRGLRRSAAVVRRPHARHHRRPTRGGRGEGDGRQAWRSASSSSGVIADRRAHPPQDDLVSMLCHAEIDGEQLDDESIVQETLLILIGGDETTPPRDHVPGCSRSSENPEQQRILASRPDTITSASRSCSGGSRRSRTCRARSSDDIEIRGQELHEGDQLILVYPSANRDDDVFAEPFRLDVERDPNPHLAFGFGPHFCLGASLARLELKVMFTELLHAPPRHRARHRRAAAVPRRPTSSSGPRRCRCGSRRRRARPA